MWMQTRAFTGREHLQYLAPHTIAYLLHISGARGVHLRCKKRASPALVDMQDSQTVPPILTLCFLFCRSWSLLQTASEKVMRETAVGLVRQCMRTSGESMPGLMEAVRAGMCARRCVARAMLTELATECLSAPPTLTTPRFARGQDGGDGGGGGAGEESRSEADSTSGHSVLELDDGEASGTGLLLDQAQGGEGHAPGRATDKEMERMVDMEMLLELVVLPESRSEAVQARTLDRLS